jgi:DNA primase
MLSFKNKLAVINVLDDLLGVGSSLKGNEQSHHCPFCHHHKKKLQVNIDTQKWHCWVCDSKGRSIYSLARKLNPTQSHITTIKRIYGDDSYEYTNNDGSESVIELKLPTEFKKLLPIPSKPSPVYKKALSYLRKRGIGLDVIQKYNIGYCDDGLYGGRVIIPSYDSEGKLNYFEARTFYDNVSLKYKKPPINRDVIMFESQINWKEPIVLVEGVFDAFSIRRNVIPLLGKFVLPKLKERIFLEGVSELHIILDSDAVLEGVRWAKYFLDNGIKIKHIVPEGKDIGDMGIQLGITTIKRHPYSSWDSILMSKLNV